MLIKRSWILIGIVLILLFGTGLPIISCTMFQNKNIEQAFALGLTPAEFNILDAAIHEYLYEKYPFLRDTEFGIRYEKVDTKVEGIWPQFLIIDAYATFRTPPVVVRAAFFHGYVKIISETVTNEGEDFSNE